MFISVNFGIPSRFFVLKVFSLLYLWLSFNLITSTITTFFKILSVSTYKILSHNAKRYFGVNIELVSRGGAKLVVVR